MTRSRTVIVVALLALLLGLALHPAGAAQTEAELMAALLTPADLGPGVEVVLEHSSPGLAHVSLGRSVGRSFELIGIFLRSDGSTSPSQLLDAAIVGFRAGAREADPSADLLVTPSAAPPLGDAAARASISLTAQGERINGDLIAWRRGSVVALTTLLTFGSADVLPVAQKQDAKLIAAFGAATPATSPPVLALQPPAAITATATPQRDISAALLTLADLPAGWTAVEGLDELASGAGRQSNPLAECSGGIDLSALEPEARALVAFQRGRTGPVLVHVVSVFPPGTTARLTEQYTPEQAAETQACLRSKLAELEQEGVSVDVEIFPSPQLGDESYAGRVVVRSPLLSLQFEMVMIRRGDAYAVLMYATMDPAADEPDRLLEALAPLADQRLAGIVATGAPPGANDGAVMQLLRASMSRVASGN